MKRIMILLPAAVLLACTQRGPVELGLRLAKGQTIAYTITVSQEVAQTIAAGTTVISQDSTLGYSFEVLDAAPSGMMKMKASYTAFSIDLRMSTGRMRFDSRNPGGATPGLDMLGGMIGDGFTFDIDRLGNARNIAGLSELLDRVALRANEGDRTRVASALQAFVNEKAVAASLSSFFGFYPDHRVTKDERWYTSQQVGGELPLEMRNTWRLAGVSVRTVRLQLDSAVANLEPRSGIALSGTQTGAFEVERSSGRILAGHIEQMISGSLIVQSVIVPIRITNSIVIK